MVVVVSLFASGALFVGFFGSLAALRRLPVPPVPGAIIAAVVGGIAWFVAVRIGRATDAVTTDEATFHHLYVLAVVGLPVVGLALVYQSFRVDAADTGTRLAVRATGIAFLVPALIGVWATHIEPRWLRLDEQTIAVGAGDGEPIRVGVIADIQTDAFGDYESSVVDRMLEQRPDLIVVAGDNTQLEWEDYLGIRGDLVDLLTRLEAPHGVYVIMGNTDPGPLEVAAVVAEAGHVSLIDETAEFEVRGRRVRLGGLAWPNNGRSESARFVDEFAASGTDGSIDILLAHSPDAMLNIADGSGVDLMISGHTHGGQIALPLVGPLWNVTELPGEIAGGGVHDIRGATTYVSTGVGVQRGESPKVRLGVRPSIAVLTIS